LNRAATATDLNAHFQSRAALSTVPPKGKAPFVVAPYLQFATRTSMTVMCETAVPTRCVVEYGDQEPLALAATSTAEATLHEIPLKNLSPKTRYVYRVKCVAADGTVTESGLLTFGTAVDVTDAWSFCVVGDTQANPKMTAKVAKSMWERRPHFVLHCGDVVDNGPVKREWTDELFTPCQDLFSRVAVFPCIGNHERNHAHYYQYFSLPKPEYYYQYRYGNAEFFSIDTNKPVGPGSEQYAWLDKALATSTARWKICYHHHPVYSSDSDDYGKTFQLSKTFEGDRNARQLAALYEKHNVDLCFNGHIHLYERSWPVRQGQVDRKNGVMYITSGGGGGKLEDVGPTPTFFKAQCRSDFHYCYVTVHGDVLEFKAFDHDGRLFDQIAVSKSNR
jgi:predicted phosphodiesterase